MVGLRLYSLRSLCFLIAMLAATSRIAAAQSADRPLLQTNEAYIEEVMRTTAFAITDSMAVFGFVLDSLPDRVKVYPTENYYYFTFLHNGTRYAGNIRLAVGERDEGKVHFAYYEDLSEWNDKTTINSFLLDASQGVKLEQIDRLLYRLSYKQKSVVFALNDLSTVRPPPSALSRNERFIGPIFDESAIRFFLVYNSRLKIFHYILDETISVADHLVPADIPRVVIGKRTGFAFYQDQKLDRKILIGVFEANARVNNYFDGPFDHLPDNFIEGEVLRSAILAIDPKLSGQIDRYGIFLDRERRYLIAPYLHYRSKGELSVFHRCVMNKRISATSYYRCFVIDDDTRAGPYPRPAILNKKRKQIIRAPI
jgi:hypothetical protein